MGDAKCEACGGSGKVRAWTMHGKGTLAERRVRLPDVPCHECVAAPEDALTEAARWAVENLRCVIELCPCARLVVPLGRTCTCANCTAWRKLSAAVGEKT
jgi:deoxycytidylate deaminase